MNKTIPSYEHVQEKIAQREHQEEDRVYCLEELVEVHRHAYPTLIQQATHTVAERITGAIATFAEIMKMSFEKVNWKIVLVILYDLIKAGYAFFVVPEGTMLYLHVYLEVFMIKNTIPYPAQHVYFFPNKTPELNRMATLQRMVDDFQHNPSNPNIEDTIHYIASSFSQ